MTHRTRTGLRYTLAALLSIGTLALTTGCGIATSASSAPVAEVKTGLHGNVHGGQQPVIGSAIHLYAAGTNGYGSINTDLLTAPVTTDGNGTFNITSLYTCMPGQQIYMVAMGGNPGGGTNNNSGLMAALGDCTTLTASRFISVNELTTVGSVYALAPFMSASDALGTSFTNTAGLTRAFASVNKLVDVGTGVAKGPALPSGATAPVATVTTLADILAACVNSQGGVAGDTTACGKLFGMITMPDGTHPADTIAAVLGIALSPTANVSGLYGLMAPENPFAGALSSAPTDWSLAIKYTNVSLNQPKASAVDANGNLWVLNAGDNTVAVLGQNGVPTAGSPFSGNGLSTPQGIAIDANGNAWITNSGTSKLSIFTATGGVFAGSPISGNGLSAPTGIAADAPGHIWVANPGNKSISEFSLTGSAIQNISTGSATPSALAINPQ